MVTGLHCGWKTTATPCSIETPEKTVFQKSCCPPPSTPSIALCHNMRFDKLVAQWELRGRCPSMYSASVLQTFDL